MHPEARVGCLDNALRFASKMGLFRADLGPGLAQPPYSSPVKMPEVQCSQEMFQLQGRLPVSGLY